MAEVTIEIRNLPQEISAFESIEAAYPEELTRAVAAIMRGLSVMIECDKGLVGFFYRAMRDRLRVQKLACMYLDGRPDPNQPPAALPMGLIATMIGQIREAVRGAVDRRVIVLPHLDLLVTNSGGLTSEAKEVIPMMYENPNILWIGFKDPSMPLPTVIEKMFPHKEGILGVNRERLRYLVTQREARKFGKDFNPYSLYKYISGVHSVRLRTLLSAVEGEDYPQNPAPAFAQLRAGTLSSDLQVPDVSLTKDIGGYTGVKDQIQQEILDLLAQKDQMTDGAEITNVESLIPRGMLFWGPPGTGKTLFAKAIATALGAAVTVISGPELKSKWVGESEERIRQVFLQARQAAPAVIVFDEIDSFATARGTYTGSGVEHSMVNQLLTEMDGFRSNEMVFVIGTTNFVESLDPALLRPGRFEFHLQIPYPDADDRRAVLGVYNKKFNLKLSPAAMDYAVKRTGEPVEGTGTPYSGDHIQALCRTLTRERIRKRRTNEPTELSDIEHGISSRIERVKFTPQEENVIATHECGHAIVSLHCPNAAPIERISIRGDIGGALGFVKYSARENKYVQTENTLRDMICSLLGGRVAERIMLNDVSTGAANDLERATGIARALVEQLGMSSMGLMFLSEDPKQPKSWSESTKIKVEEVIKEILAVEESRAVKIITDHKDQLIGLRSLVLEKKVLDRTQFANLA